MKRAGFPPDLRASRWLPVTLAALALIVYGWQAWHWAHAQLAVIDESAYLYKGYLFVSGTYRPFEAGGPQMNKPPLVFQIFGLAQLAFGPGLRTGRMFAVALGLLSVLGIGSAARRAAGRWAPVPAMWLFALNPALIKTYSLAASEVIIACLLSWMLFFALDRERRATGQLVAAALAGVMVLVRINLAPVPVLYLAYLAWRDGLPRALAALAVMAAVMVLGYAPYWPEILRIWADWLPFVRQLDPFRVPQTGQIEPYSVVWPLSVRLDSLLQTVRLHLAVLLGALVSAMFVAWRRPSPVRGQQLFLLGLFAVLFAAHAAASLGMNYCVYCLNAYMGFFYPAGALAIAACLPDWNRGAGRVALWSVWAVALALSPAAPLSGMRLPADSPCPADLLSEYEQAAETLSAVMPAGGTVYWAADDAIVTLSLVPGAVIYPPQLNNGFNYRLGGDTATLLEHGLWNERLAAIWLGSADYVVTTRPLSDPWVEVARTRPFPACGASGAWIVYR